MPNTESSTDIKYKGPTGSSKRKRKQAIKRNVTGEDKECKLTKITKVDKTYGKKIKYNKAKPKKESEDESKKNSNEKIYHKCDKGEIDQNNILLSGTERDINEKKKCEENSDVSSCNSAKQQCQNCKFCSEHKAAQQDSDDSNRRTKKKFTCELCAREGSSKTYNTIEKHKHHMATVHEVCNKEIKRFECTECPKTVWFPTKSKFTYHLGTKHPGIIKFICEVCTETFKLKANYKNHMKTHNIVVQKKFSCDGCNGTFVNKAGFEAHKKRFPGPHIKQSCSHCGFSFSKEKHLINHRCKTLLLEEAAARASSGSQAQPEQSAQSTQSTQSVKPVQPVQPAAEIQEVNLTSTKVTTTDHRTKSDEDPLIFIIHKVFAEAPTETSYLLKKEKKTNSQAGKRVVMHKIIPRRAHEQAVYRPVQVQTQSVSDPLAIKEIKEIDFEGGTYIAATTSEPEQHIIVRDINGHLVQGNQILQLDLNEVQAGEESQVYLADWNIVAPYIIREKSP